MGLSYLLSSGASGVVANDVKLVSVSRNLETQLLAEHGRGGETVIEETPRRGLGMTGEVRMSVGRLSSNKSLSGGAPTVEEAQICVVRYLNLDVVVSRGRSCRKREAKLIMNRRLWD
jgi:hypothetical protein